MFKCCRRAVSYHHSRRNGDKGRQLPLELVAEGSTVESKPKYFRPDNFNSLPRLQHGLERVLFNPGVHFLRDPRTKIYNFDPYLRFITQPKDFNYEAVPSFVPPSHDTKLSLLARDNDCLFTGSTSSTSSVLSHFYLLISNFKPVTLGTHLPGEFVDEHKTFTRMVKLPTAVQIIPQPNGTVSIDYYPLEAKNENNNGEPNNAILMQQGVVLENFFTRSPADYGKMLLANSAADLTERPSMPSDGYAYCKHGSLLLRSQLDCTNSHLPRQSFDIKTRATVAIRMNSAQYYEFLNYRLHRSFGKWNSFSREYYDMLRSAFLKYSFQVRIGDMDGIFVSYHNTNEIFGFQYVCREEMDSVLFGSEALGDQVFQICLQLFNTLLGRLRTSIPTPFDRPLNLLFNTTSNRMYVYAVDSLQPFVDGGNVNGDDGTVRKKWMFEVKRLVNGQEIEKNESPSIGDKDCLEIAYRLFEGSPVDEANGLADEVQAIVKRVQRPLSATMPFTAQFFKPYFSSPDDDDSGKPIIVY